MPLDSTAPLRMSRRQAVLRPVVRQHAAGKMRARRMRRADKAGRGRRRKFVGVAIDPADRAPHLLDHRKQVAAGLIDIGEIEHHGMRAGVNEAARPERRNRPRAGAPGAAVNEDRDGRVRRFGAIRRRAPRFASDRKRSAAARRAARAPPAVGEPALGDLLAVRRIDILVVGVVELLLVHVEPDDRAFGLRRRGGQSECSSHVFPHDLPELPLLAAKAGASISA